MTTTAATYLFPCTRSSKPSHSFTFPTKSYMFLSYVPFVLHAQSTQFSFILSLSLHWVRWTNHKAPISLFSQLSYCFLHLPQHHILKGTRQIVFSYCGRQSLILFHIYIKRWAKLQFAILQCLYPYTANAKTKYLVF